MSDSSSNAASAGDSSSDPSLSDRAKTNDPIRDGSLLDDLQWRGLVHQCTDLDALKTHLASGPQTVYIGFDPTADSLHAGSMMQLMLLRRFQTFGHRPIALVGGATGMIGDPSGKSKERNLLGAEALQQNVEGIANQMKKFLRFDGENAAILVNNFDWMKDYGYIDFLRDIGKAFPVGAMMGKESVRARIDSAAGLSYTEFSYMLLQAYDFVRLHDDFGCNIEAGGSDQWGNITAGIDLGRRLRGASLYGLTAPLLTTSDGRKMGKTEQGAIWLDANRTSPYEFHQYWRNVADDDVMRCIAFLTEIPKDKYDDLHRSVQEDPAGRHAQNALADWMTEFVHGSDGLASATQAAKKLFSGDLSGSTDESLASMFADVPTAEMPSADLDGDGLWIVDALVATGLAKSKGEARRTIKEGGAYVDNTRVSDEQTRLNRSHLTSESVMVLRRGKKKYALIKFMS